MSSTIDLYHCDYLDQHKLPPPFTSEREELAHIDDRSRHLHNSLSPISKIPVEILSYIFELVDLTDYCLPKHQYYRAYLCQAFELASVSSHFRRTAFGTPELWRRVGLGIVKRNSIDNASFVLRYCSTLTPSLDLVVLLGSELDDKEMSRSCVDALITSDITRKVKSFDFQGYSFSSLWIERLTDLGSPTLNTLNISTGNTPLLSFDIRVLTAVNRLKLSSGMINTAILVPPSLQYLTVENVPGENLDRLLRQCPNLVECDIAWYGASSSDIEFIEPLTLPHLKFLSFYGLYLITSCASLEKFHLPSLKNLSFEPFEEENVPLCHNFSATLTSLSIDTEMRFLNDGLIQLPSMSLPKLEELDIILWEEYPFSHLNQSLEQMEDDHHHNPQLRYPVLRSIVITVFETMTPSSVLTWLRESKIGRAFFYSVDFRFLEDEPDDWPPDFREELRSIVGSRRMKIIWRSRYGEDATDGFL